MEETTWSKLHLQSQKNIYVNLGNSPFAGGGGIMCRPHSLLLLPSTRRLYLCHCVFVCQQDNSKSSGQILMTLLEGRDVWL